MTRPVARIRAVEAVFALTVVAILARAVQLQLVQGRQWAAAATETRTEDVPIPARRGSLLDRDGSPLAVSQEFYHLGIAPNEVSDRSATLRAVARALGIPPARLQRDWKSGRSWLYYHGPYTAEQVAGIRSLRGIHLEPEYARFYPAHDLARPLIGGLSPDSAVGASGLELSLDRILQGTPGEQVLLKDSRGRRYESPSRVVRQPIPGDDILLTIDSELQEIAEAALDQAMRTYRADGGDVVFYDPHNGELLAIASRQAGGRPDRPTAFTDPAEPGSTAKLFTAAALLMLDRVRQSDSVSGEHGVWHVPGRRKPIRDVEEHDGYLTLAQAIEVSSNIAMAKFSERLSSDEQYDMLRDFGFGSPTGVEFPSESRGRLARPDRWSGESGHSLAMGYELEVTPLQLAVAYGAIADDGILLSPTLVREIRAPDGKVLYRHRPEPVRRCITPEVAAELRDFLRGAVSEGGTGARAQLANYTLLGKTGTAIRHEGGAYVAGSYTASFAALFPANDPQLVVIVKIENPKGSIYGGETAAPITRDMLQQALAARSVAIDRSQFAVKDTVRDSPDETEPENEDRATVALPWPFTAADTEAAAQRREVPPVSGLTVRRAVTLLHRRGFRVVLHGLGKVQRASAAAGDSLAVGSSIQIWAD